MGRSALSSTLSTSARRVLGAVLVAGVVGALLPAPFASAESKPAPVEAEPAAADLPPGSEVAAARRQHSKTYTTDKPGRYRTEIVDYPIHFEDASGKWKDIDKKLAPGKKDGHVSTVANDWTLHVREDAGDGQLVQLDLAGGEHSLGYGITGARKVKGKVKDGKPTEFRWDGIAPGVDLELTALSSGVKESIVLRDADTPTEYVFPLHLRNLTARLTEAGDVVYLDAAGGVRARTPRGFMVDSNVDPRSGEAAQSTGVTYRLTTQVPTGIGLVVTLDAKWLRDPARRYPVVVDPSYSTNSDDTFVQYPYVNDYSTQTELKSGTFNGGGDKARSFLHFTGINVLDGKVINSATFQAYNYHSYSCTARVTRLYRVNTSWAGATTKSYPGPAPSTLIDEDNSARGYSGCAAGYATFSATTAMRYWADGTWGNYGVALVAASETDNLNWRKWYASEHSTTTDPKMVVDWSEPNALPSSPMGRTLRPGCGGGCTGVTYTSDPSPVVTATANDADGDTLQYAFEVWDGHLTDTTSTGEPDSTGSVRVAASPRVPTTPIASGTQGSWTVTALPDGDYSFRVRAWDGQAYGKWGLGWFQFTIDSTPPPAPSIYSSTHPTETSWYRSSAPSFGWSVTDASPIVWHSYVLDQSPTTVPDTIAETSSKSFSTSGLADGSYYLHVRSENKAALWGPADHFKINVDTATPGGVSGLTSTSHLPHAPSNDRTVDVTWQPATDVTSGVLGYYYAFSNAATRDGATSTVSDTYTSTTARTSPTLADGSWYVHVRAMDRAGNVGPYNSYGPFVIDAAGPSTPVVTSATHPSGEWRASRTASFAWTSISEGAAVTGYAVAVDQVAGTDPGLAVTNTSPSHTVTVPHDGIWYVHVKAVDSAGNWSGTAHYEFRVDATPSAAPGLTITPQSDPAKWYPYDDATLAFGGDDTSGVTTHQYLVDRSPSTEPLLGQTTDQRQVTVWDLADGVWYVHVRARNGALQWSETTHRAFRVDDTVPTAPALTSPTHRGTGASSERVVTVDWAGSPGTDATSGVAGYSVAFNQSSTTAAGTTVTTTGTMADSPSLADGTWYAHVRTVDNAGNVSSDTVLGPIQISGTAPPVNDAERDRFVALWKPRVVDETYGTTWIQANGYPQDVLDEGFHGLRETQKRYLIAQLYTALRGDAPPDEDDPQIEDELEELLYDLVFSKDDLRDIANISAISHVVQETTQEVVDRTPPILTDAIVDRALEFVPVNEPVEPLPAISELDVESLLTDQIDIPAVDVPATLLPETNALVGQLTDGLSDPLGEVLAQVDAVTAESAVDDVVGKVFEVAEALPVSVDYAICWQSATSADCVENNVINLPVDVDVTGDGSSDVNVTFGLDTDTSVPPPPGVGFKYEVGRPVLNAAASDTAGMPVRAHVWIAYDVDLNTNTRLLVGYDGYTRGAALSERTVGKVRLPDLLELPANQFRATYSLTHTDPAAKWALTLGIRRSTGDPDPIDASLLFTPPRDYSGEVKVRDDGTPANGADKTVEVRVDGSGPSKLDALVKTLKTSTDAATSTRLLVEDLPESSTTTVRRKTSTTGVETTQVDTSTSAAVSRVAVSHVSTTPQQRTRAVGELRDLPRTAKYVLTSHEGRFHHDYEASSTVTRLSGAFTKHVDDVLQVAASGRLTGLPTDVDLRYGPSEQAGDDRMLLTYNADATMPTLDAAGYSRAEAIVVGAKLRSIPRIVTGSASKADKHVEFDTSAPIGLVDVVLARDGGRVHRPAAPEHVSFVSANGAIGVSARVSGLESVTADYGETLHAIIDTSPGGQRMLIVGRYDALYGWADVSQLPTHFDALVDQGLTHAHFNASARIPRLSFYGRLAAGPHAEGVLTDVPTDVDVRATLGKPKTTLKYRADQTLGGVERVLFTTDGTPGDRTGITAKGTMESLPRELDLEFDRGLKDIHADTNDTGTAGLIEATMSAEGGKAQLLAGDHATFHGTTDSFGASLRLHGLKYVDIDMTGGLPWLTAEIKVSPGGQPFTASGTLDDKRGYAHISNLPSRTYVKLESLKHVYFEAAQPIAKVDVYGAVVGTGPTMQGSISETPVSGDLTVTVDDPKTTIEFVGQGNAAGASGFYSERYVDRRSTPADRFVSASVTGITDDFTVTYDKTTKRIEWRDADPVTEVKASVKNMFLDGLKAEAVLRGVPGSADIGFGKDDYLFDVVPAGGKLSYAKARGTNLPKSPTNWFSKHLYAHADLSDGTFDVSAELTDVSKVKYHKSGAGLEVAADVDLHGSPLLLDVSLDDAVEQARANSAEFRVEAAGRLDVLPDRLTFSQSDAGFVYDASGSFGANIGVRIGWVPALVKPGDSPPVRYGVSVRDRGCLPSEGCVTTDAAGEELPLCKKDDPAKTDDVAKCHALAAHLAMDGLPSRVSFDSQGPVVEIAGFSPSRGYLDLHAMLDDLVSSPVTVEVRQSGIVAGKALEFGPISVGKKDDNAESLPFHVETDHEAPMGELSGSVASPGLEKEVGDYRYRELDAAFKISHVPARLLIDATFGSVTTARVEASHTVPMITVSPDMLVERKEGAGWQSLGVAEATVELGGIPVSTAGSAVLLTALAPVKDEDEASSSNPCADKPDSEKNEMARPPTLIFQAPDSTVDIGLAVDSGVLTFGAGCRTSISLGPIRAGLGDLGKQVTASFDPEKNKLEVSSPLSTTGEVYFELDGLEFRKSFLQKSVDVSVPRVAKLHAAVDLRVEVDSDKVGVLMTGINSFKLDLTSLPVLGTVEGSYSRFELWTPGVSVRGVLETELVIERWPFWSWLPKTFEKRTHDDIQEDGFRSHVFRADAYRPMGACLRGQIGPVSASIGLELKPSRRPGGNELNGVTTYGVDGRQMFTYVDPSWGPFLAAAIDVIPIIWDPFDSRGVRVATAWGDGACY